MSLKPGKYNKSTDPVLRGKECPYCHGSTHYIDSRHIYGKSYGMMYFCHPCQASVGVHQGTDESLGRLANRELKELKKRAHAAFDPLFKDYPITVLIHMDFPNELPEHLKEASMRKKAYWWLSRTLDIPFEECHIGMMQTWDCEQVIAESYEAAKRIDAFLDKQNPTLF